MQRKIFGTGLLFLFLLLACRSDDIRINVTFEHLSGLAIGDRILFEQNVAGRVQSIQYSQDGIYTVGLQINEGFTSTATEYTQFYLTDDSSRDGHKAIEVRLTRQGGTPLADGASVKGISTLTDLADRFKKDFEDGFSFLKKQFEKFGRDVQQIPESDEYKNLKKSLEDLAAEIEKKEKETREEVKRKWLPQIQREIDSLRERLRKFGREYELKPLEERVQRIREI